jgi:hypothetical protein
MLSKLITPCQISTGSYKSNKKIVLTIYKIKFMKKYALLVLSIATFALVANSQNLLKDGDFSSTSIGNFKLGSTSYVNISSSRNSWGGQCTTQDDDATPAKIGVVSDEGTVNKCVSFTRGTTKPGPISPATYLYQRLSASAQLSTTKTYKLLFKAKSINSNQSCFFYIRNRAATKFAVRADFKYDVNEIWGWCIYRSSIPTTWTEYSQTFVFSNSVFATSVISSTQPAALTSPVPFTEAELKDLVVCFYSNSTEGGTIYIDDVVFEEVPGSSK